MDHRSLFGMEVFASSALKEGEVLIVPKSVFRSLLMHGVDSPLPVEAFFAKGVKVTDTKKSQEVSAPAVETEANDPLAGLVPGRVVHYHPRVHEARNCAPGPWAAIVTAVRIPEPGSGQEPGLVTLNVMMPAPPKVGTDPVMRVADVSYSKAGEEGRWSWIPRN